MPGIEHRQISGQRQLWLDIAETAVRRWLNPSRKIRWLGHTGNLVFRVTTAHADYVLRLHPVGSVDAGRLNSELHWLAAIRRETDLLAPLPVKALVGGREQPFLELRHQSLPAVVYAVLYEYIHGELKSAGELSARDVYRIGEYLGALHTEAQLDVPSDFNRPRLDWEGLFGQNSPYASPRKRTQLSAEQRAILEDVAQRLRAPLTVLASSPHSTGLIHADLLAKNIVFRADSIAALDFEYCGWGFFLYDLAPILWQLKGERTDDYHELEAAIWRGYTSVRPIADGDRERLEPLIAARQVASIRWLLANQQHPTIRALTPTLIAERCQELQLFLETGLLRRFTPTL